MRHDFFETMTPQAAWLLGFLASDGTVNVGSKTPNGVAICLGRTDVEILHRIKAMLETPNTVGEYFNGKTQTYKLAFSSSRIKEFLISIDFKEKYPDCVRGFDRHYIRGLYDGDGCIHYRGDRKSLNLHLAGNYAILAEVSTVFGRELGANVRAPLPTNDNTNQLSYEGRMARYLYWWLYSNDCGISLARKKAFLETLPFAEVRSEVELPPLFKALISISGPMEQPISVRRETNGVEIALAGNFQNRKAVCDEFCRMAGLVGLSPTVVRRSKGLYHHSYSVYVPERQFSCVHTLEPARSLLAGMV
jgi:hypothetical protein